MLQGQAFAARSAANGSYKRQIWLAHQWADAGITTGAMKASIMPPFAFQAYMITNKTW